MCICLTCAHLRKIIRIRFATYMATCSIYRTHVHSDSSHSISWSTDQAGVASRRQWPITEVPRQLVISWLFQSGTWGAPNYPYSMLWRIYWAPPHTDLTMSSLCLQWFSNGIQPFRCKGSIPDTDVASLPRSYSFSALPWLGSQGLVNGNRRFLQSNFAEQKC